MLYRQGDVLIQRVEEVPEYAEAATPDHGRIVLAYGEVTGHAHAILEKEIEAFEDQGTLYLVVPEAGARVSHEEHAPIQLPQGTYRVLRQVEATPWGSRRVAD
jgi:hypothetical protein